MTAIELLERLGADATFKQNLLSEEDKRTIENVIRKAKVFNAIEIVHAPDEEGEEPEEKPEEEKNE
jgi:hypothetical protein